MEKATIEDLRALVILFTEAGKEKEDAADVVDKRLDEATDAHISIMSAFYSFAKTKEAKENHWDIAINNLNNVKLQELGSLFAEL